MTPPPFSAELSLQRFEAYLRAEVVALLGGRTPSQLASAIEHAVFRGGSRLRPTLGLALAHAMALEQDHRILAICAAVELVHCASLVHDDLPCFDDASLRRGYPSVHKKFGEATAVLTGDALITMSFTLLAGHPAGEVNAQILPFSQAIGPAQGIIGGQALELEKLGVDRDHYHDAKTGALFAFLARATAQLAEQEFGPWERWGQGLGRIYQRCDDLSDHAQSSLTGKTSGQDQRHDRPTWATSNSGGEPSDLRTQIESLKVGLEALLRDELPPCASRSAIQSWISLFQRRLSRHLGIQDQHQK